MSDFDFDENASQKKSERRTHWDYPVNQSFAANWVINFYASKKYFFNVKVLNCLDDIHQYLMFSFQHPQRSSPLVVHATPLDFNMDKNEFLSKMKELFGKYVAMDNKYRDSISGWYQERGLDPFEAHNWG